MAFRLIPPATKAAIVAELRAGGSRSGTARRFGVSHHTARCLARAAGLPIASPNLRLQLANEVHVLAARERRAARVLELLDVADRLLDQFHEPCELLAWDGQHGSWARAPLPAPLPRELQALAIALGIVLQRSLELERVDRVGSAAGKAAIVGLFEILRADVAAS